MSVPDGDILCCVYSHIKADNIVIFLDLMLQESIHWSLLDLRKKQIRNKRKKQRAVRIVSLKI